MIELAVRGALAAGAHDGRAVALLADRRARPEPETLTGLPERLAQHDRPAPTLSGYDRAARPGAGTMTAARITTRHAGAGRSR